MSAVHGVRDIPAVQRSGVAVDRRRDRHQMAAANRGSLSFPDLLPQLDPRCRRPTGVRFFSSTAGHEGLIHCFIRAGITRHRTAGVGKRGHRPSLYHSRQCGIVSRLDWLPRRPRRLLYNARLHPKTVKTVAVQAKCGLMSVAAYRHLRTATRT